MRIMGVDASTKSFAYCLMENGKILSYGQYFYEGSNLIERLSDSLLKHQAIANMDEFKDIDYVVFEAAVNVRSQSTLIAMAKSFGIAEAIWASKGAIIVEVTPMTWQSYIGNPNITGSVKRDFVLARPFLKTKSQIDKYVREYRKKVTMDWAEAKYGIKAETDDVSDAVGISSWAYDKIGQL